MTTQFSEHGGNLLAENSNILHGVKGVVQIQTQCYFSTKFFNALKDLGKKDRKIKRSLREQLGCDR